MLAERVCGAELGSQEGLRTDPSVYVCVLLGRGNHLTFTAWRTPLPFSSQGWVDEERGDHSGGQMPL